VVKVASRRNFQRSDDLVCHWSVQKNGLTVEAGLLDIILGPGAAETVTIPYTVKPSEVECHFTVEWRLKADTNWGRSGHLVGWDQLTISTVSLNPTAPPIDATAATTCNLPSHIGWGETIVKLAKDGSVAGVELGGLPVIDGDVTACLWRAPIDNDGVKTMESIGLPNRRAEWISLGLDRLSQSRPKVRIENDQLLLEREWRSESGEKAVHRSRWQQDDGGIRIDEEITIPEAWADIPRVGVRFEVPAGNETLTWFGLGPDESYSDRSKAQTVGVWHSTVADQFHEYALPQETGAHQDTRSFSLKKVNGTGFEIILPRPISFSARHQHDADIDRSRTLADLVRRETIEVHIDAAMRGVGTGACGPDALPAYRVRPGVYAFSWVLKPALAQ
jgi:beta-galactosidase